MCNDSFAAKLLAVRAIQRPLDARETADLINAAYAASRKYAAAADRDLVGNVVEAVAAQFRAERDCIADQFAAERDSIAQSERKAERLVVEQVKAMSKGVAALIERADNELTGLMRELEGAALSFLDGKDTSLHPTDRSHPLIFGAERRKLDAAQRRAERRT